MSSFKLPHIVRRDIQATEKRRKKGEGVLLPRIVVEKNKPIARNLTDVSKSKLNFSNEGCSPYSKSDHKLPAKSYARRKHSRKFRLPTLTDRHLQVSDAGRSEPRRPSLVCLHDELPNRGESTHLTTTRALQALQSKPGAFRQQDLIARQLADLSHLSAIDYHHRSTSLCGVPGRKNPNLLYPYHLPNSESGNAGCDTNSLHRGTVHPSLQQQQLKEVPNRFHLSPYMSSRRTSLPVPPRHSVLRRGRPVRRSLQPVQEVHNQWKKQTKSLGHYIRSQIMQLSIPLQLSGMSVTRSFVHLRSQPPQPVPLRRCMSEWCLEASFRRVRLWRRKRCNSYAMRGPRVSVGYSGRALPGAGLCASVAPQYVLSTVPCVRREHCQADSSLLAIEKEYPKLLKKAQQLGFYSGVFMSDLPDPKPERKIDPLAAGRRRKPQPVSKARSRQAVSTIDMSGSHNSHVSLQLPVSVAAPTPTKRVDPGFSKSDACALAAPKLGAETGPRHYDDSFLSTPQVELPEPIPCSALSALSPISSPSVVAAALTPPCSPSAVTAALTPPCSPAVVTPVLPPASSPAVKTPALTPAAVKTPALTPAAAVTEIEHPVSSNTHESDFTSDENSQGSIFESAPSVGIPNDAPPVQPKNDFKEEGNKSQSKIPRKSVDPVTKGQPAQPLKSNRGIVRKGPLNATFRQDGASEKTKKSPAPKPPPRTRDPPKQPTESKDIVKPKKDHQPVKVSVSKPNPPLEPKASSPPLESKASSPPLEPNVSSPPSSSLQQESSITKAASPVQETIVERPSTKSSRVSSIHSGGRASTQLQQQQQRTGSCSSVPSSASTLQSSSTGASSAVSSASVSTASSRQESGVSTGLSGKTEEVLFAVPKQPPAKKMVGKAIVKEIPVKPKVENIQWQKESQKQVEDNEEEEEERKRRLKLQLEQERLEKQREKALLEQQRAQRLREDMEQKARELQWMKAMQIEEEKRLARESEQIIKMKQMDLERKAQQALMCAIQADYMDVVSYWGAHEGAEIADYASDDYLSELRQLQEEEEELRRLRAAEGERRRLQEQEESRRRMWAALCAEVQQEWASQKAIELTPAFVYSYFSANVIPNRE